MLTLTHQIREPRTKAIYDFENNFINKIKLAENLPNYKEIEEYAQNCIYWHTGFGFYSIQAQVIMKKINAMSDDEFIQWAQAIEKDGEKE